jgi:thiol-disulfide isomerase/thioredoxin
MLHDFEPNGEYLLYVDGQAVPGAEILRADRLPAFLLISKALSAPVILLPRDGTAAAVAAAQLTRRPDGAIDVQAGTVPTPLGKLTIEGDSAGFGEQGHQVSLRVKPALVGVHPGADLESYNPAFRRRADLDKPNADALAALRAVRQPTTVRIVFGSWCPHCQQKVPNILRVERELKGSQIAFEYYGLPRPPEAWQDPEVKRLGINTVPTATVSIGGSEIGRILSVAWDAPEVILAKLLAKVAGAPAP